MERVGGRADDEAIGTARGERFGEKALAVKNGRRSSHTVSEILIAPSAGEIGSEALFPASDVVLCDSISS